MSDLAVFELDAPSAVAVFTDTEKYSEFFTKLKTETDKFVPDATTRSGRDEIKSTAFRVTKVKTSLAKTALELTEDWRQKTAAVNKSRAKMVEELAQLADTIRKPLTDWEAAEDKRLRDCRATIDGFKAAAAVTLDDTSETVRARWNAVIGVAASPDVFQDMFDEACETQKATINTLANAVTRLVKEEADRAELRRLQDAEADRQRQEAERLAAQQAERDEAERERLAAEKIAADKEAEEERLEQAKCDAAAEADRVAKEKAEAEARKVERKHQEELAAEKKRADDAAAAEAKRASDAKAEADAQAKRDADQAHRTAIKSAAKTAIMSCGADEESARKIVMAILAGEIPNVTLRF